MCPVIREGLVKNDRSLTFLPPNCLGMKDRIRQLRGDMPQERFAAKLGKASRTVARWEKGDTTPSEADLLLIVHQMDVRYEWLKHGTGPMRESVVDKTETTRTDTGGEGVAGTLEKPLYLYVRFGGGVVRFRLSEPKLLSSFTVETDDFFISEEDSAVTEGNPNS